jgi:hypothetical protein
MTKKCEVVCEYSWEETKRGEMSVDTAALCWQLEVVNGMQCCYWLRNKLEEVHKRLA